ncbi:kinesin KIF2A [Brachionus plicatilis]|uniref:Kinesin KIF2A n=1 Tax=Brachionus plicatilis TaxID=10195 RepID=A0A3M7QD28_BRAPC|nr:kinesin KIF2A [Brachionus plicatilis]
MSVQPVYCSGCSTFCWSISLVACSIQATSLRILLFGFVMQSLCDKTLLLLFKFKNNYKKFSLFLLYDCVCAQDKKQISKKDIDVMTMPNKDQCLFHLPKCKVDLTKYLDNQKFRFDFAFDESTSNALIYRILLESGFFPILLKKSNKNLKKVNTLQDCEITSLVTANFCFQWNIRCRSLFDFVAIHTSTIQLIFNLGCQYGTQ